MKINFKSCYAYPKLGKYISFLLTKHLLPNLGSNILRKKGVNLPTIVLPAVNEIF